MSGETATNRYQRIRLVGTGAFGKVFLVRSSVSGAEYVVKEIQCSGLTPPSKAAALNEIRVLRTLDHPFVCRYRNAWLSHSVLNICMEYCCGGDLHQLINERGTLHFLESDILSWFAQMSLAVDYLHSRRILHRDIKSQNIFLTGDRTVIKLGDFGISKVLTDTAAHAQTMVGTPYYLSPEICQGLPYSFKSDIWALGCVLYEMASLKHAFDAGNIGALIIRIVSGYYPPLPDQYSPEFVRLSKKMLSLSPDDRPDAEGLLRSRLLRPYLKDSIELAKIAAELSKPQVIASSESLEQHEETTTDETPPAVPVVEDVLSLSQKQKMNAVADMMMKLHSSEDISTPAKVEAVRDFLEAQIGMDALLSCHRALLELHDDQSESDQIELVKNGLGSGWMFLPLIVQLVNCEKALGF